MSVLIFILYCFYFLLTIFVAFFIPGNIFLRKINLSFFQKTVLSYGIGLVFWGLQGFIFGFLNLRWFSYIYLFVFFVFFILKLNWRQIQLSQKYIPDILLVLIIIGGVFLQVFPNWNNGLAYKDGMYFCCNTPDIFYHIAMTNELITHVPPHEPGMSGVIVKNYHYLSNLIIADLIRVFHVPLLETVNQFIPLFISVLMGLSLIVFAQLLKLKKTTIRWILFFLYFWGDSIYLITALLGRGFNFDPSLLQNAITIWDSPPRVFAIAIFFVGLSLLVYGIKKNSYYGDILSAIIFASLIGIKVYIGFFTITGFICVMVFRYIIKKEKNVIIPVVVTFLLMFILYVPINSGAGGLVFSGFWRIEDFAIQKAFGLTKMELSRVVYLEHKNYIHAYLYDAIYLLLYIASLLGVFLLGFVQTKKSLARIPTEIHILLISGSCVCFLIGMFFLQSIGGANTIQFLFPLYIVGSIYTGNAISYWNSFLHKRWQLVFIIIFIVGLTSTRVLYETSHTINAVREKKGFFISAQQLSALQYLYTSTPNNSIIFFDNSFTVYGKGDIVRDNYLYFMPFLSHRQAFLIGSGILADHGVHVAQRNLIQENLLKNYYLNTHREVLVQNNISYLYVSRKSTFIKTHPIDFLEVVYKNNEVVIYKVGMTHNNEKNI